MWRMSLDWMVLMTTFDLMGGALYAMGVSNLVKRHRMQQHGVLRTDLRQIPEKGYPYRFDIRGSITRSCTVW
jgi:adiponectin receptor